MLLLPEEILRGEVLKFYMDRREALLTAGLLPFVSGCLSHIFSGGTPDTTLPDGVTSLDFEIRDQVTRDPELDPTIQINELTNDITVTGSLFVGSSKCNEAALGSTTFAPETATLEVHIKPGKSADHPDNSLFATSCTEDMSADEYWIQIRVTDAVRTIHVLETDAKDETRSATASVE